MLGLLVLVCLVAMCVHGQVAQAATVVTVQGGKAYLETGTAEDGVGSADGTGRLYTPSANELVQTPDGTLYGVRPTGSLLTGRALVNGTYRIFTATGTLSCGSANHACAVNGTTYLADGEGNALSGLQTVRGVRYVANAKGVLLKGLSKATVKVVNGVKYGVAKSTGKGYTGKIKYKKSYYLFKQGSLSTGGAKHTVSAAGAVYGASKAGKMLTGTHVIKDKLMVFKANGKRSAAKTKRLRKAAKRGKSYEAFVKVAGNPQSVRYISGSCYGAGDDGVVKYKYFYLYTFRSAETGKVIVLDYESR